MGFMALRLYCIQSHSFGELCQKQQQCNKAALQPSSLSVGLVITPVNYYAHNHEPHKKCSFQYTPVKLRTDSLMVQLLYESNKVITCKVQRCWWIYLPLSEGKYFTHFTQTVFVASYLTNRQTADFRAAMNKFILQLFILLFILQLLFIQLNKHLTFVGCNSFLLTEYLWVSDLVGVTLFCGKL